MRHALLLPLLLPLLALAGAAGAQAPVKPLQPLRSVEGIHEYRLANGLQVLLAPDASKPSTTVNVTYRVGSKHENYGETGMAHLLEHLLFKGSPKHPAPWGEFSQRGLDANGTTWFDRTNYFASFSANPDTLKWYLGWQADAMVNSNIARKDLATEFSVVRNEMEMGENNPGSITWERLWATMFQWHNYGKSTIGARTDVENVDIGRLKAFYKLHYQPDNATLIVTGKFEPTQTLAWIQQAFGPLPKSRQARPRLYTIDPVQDGERSVTIRRSGGTPSATLGYHAPPAAHPDFAAVELLSMVLTEPPAGRLHKRLVEELRSAASVSGYAVPLAEPGALLLGADTQPGGDAQALSVELIREAEALAAKPITQAELERARTRWLNRWDKLYGDPQAVGTVLSEYLSAGDWRLFFLLRDRVKALKLEDLQRVANERLLPANRTLALYIPTEKPQRAPKPARWTWPHSCRTSCRARPPPPWPPSTPRRWPSRRRPSACNSLAACRPCCCPSRRAATRWPARCSCAWAICNRCAASALRPTCLPPCSTKARARSTASSCVTASTPSRSNCRCRTRPAA
jgi:zinc protease